MPSEILMPQLGESVIEGTVSAWLKRIGDPVARFEPLLIVETDKVTTEIPSPSAGTLLEVYVHEGETVAKGTRLALIAHADEAPTQPSPAIVDAPHGARPPQPAKASPSLQHPLPSAWHITPVVARMAAEHQLDLSTIPGSGRGGRVTKKDIEAHLARHTADVPEKPFAASATPPDVRSVRQEDEHAPWETPGSGDLFKPTEEYSDAVPAHSAQIHLDDGDALMPLTAMRRTIAERMTFSRQHSAHVTTVWEIDLSAVQAHRAAQREALARQGVRLTLTSYFVAAISQALHAVPVLNGEWREEGILLHRHHQIGIAVALDEGLIVPVLRDVEAMSLTGIARGVHGLAERARTHRLTADEVKGGTFTLTNHGVSGSLFATPIITPPQVGILGVGAMEQRVKVIDGMIAIRPCVYASLTFDHRAADGATADAFMAVLKQTLEKWSS